MMKKEKGLIVAFDGIDLTKVIELAQDIKSFEGNIAIKFGRPMEMAFGLKALPVIKAIAGCPIIYDGKIADVPFISAEIARQVYEAGADAVIIQGFVGQDVIQKVVELHMGDVIVVASMTHPGSVLIDEKVETIVGWTLEVGAHGLVLPAPKSDIIESTRRLWGIDHAYIISPGIKAQGAKPGDAIKAGADYEVVGRAITGAERPLDALEILYEEIVK